MPNHIWCSQGMFCEKREKWRCRAVVAQTTTSHSTTTRITTSHLQVTKFEYAVSRRRYGNTTINLFKQHNIILYFWKLVAAYSCITLFHCVFLLQIGWHWRWDSLYVNVTFKRMQRQKIMNEECVFHFFFLKNVLVMFTILISVIKLYVKS